MIGPLFPSAVLEQRVGAVRALSGTFAAVWRGEASLETEPGLLPGPIQDHRLITACQQGHRPRGRPSLSGEARNPSSFSWGVMVWKENAGSEAQTFFRLTFFSRFFFFPPLPAAPPSSLLLWGWGGEGEARKEAFGSPAWEMLRPEYCQGERTFAFTHLTSGLGRNVRHLFNQCPSSPPASLLPGD